MSNKVEATWHGGDDAARVEAELVQRLIDLDAESGAPFDSAMPGASQIAVEPTP